VSSADRSLPGNCFTRDLAGPGLVGPTTFVRPPAAPARDTAAAARLWAEAERLTGVSLPAGASTPDRLGC
jgi:hypothetical protein